MTTANRLYRRVMNVVAAVKITATDDAGPVHRAQVRGFAPETIDHMPVLQIFGLASHAAPGSDGVALFASGDRSNGVIIATGNQGLRHRGLKPGEVALYDGKGTVVKLAAGGIIEIVCNTEIKLTAPKVTITAPHVNLVGDLFVEGNIHATGVIEGDGGIAGSGGTIWDP